MLRGVERKQLRVHRSRIRESRGKGPGASACTDAAWLRTAAQSVGHLSASFYKTWSIPRRHPHSRKRRMIDETRMSTFNLSEQAVKKFLVSECFEALTVLCD